MEEKIVTREEAELILSAYKSGEKFNGQDDDGDTVNIEMHQGYCIVKFTSGREEKLINDSFCIL